MTFSLTHFAPHTTGIMDNYGVVKDASNLVIDGIGTIKQGNHQSSSHQTNKIIVFDEKCNAKANPYLYIDEYDVKASHGASVGKIDEDHLYYLQSRGLSKKDAMHLVTYGYFIPVMEFIDNADLREMFNETIKRKGWGFNVKNVRKICQEFSHVKWCYDDMVNPLIYFDNGATTLKPQCVIDAVC